MLALVLFVLFLTLGGASASASYRLFPAVGRLPASGADLLFGGLAGALLGGMLALLWRRTASWFETDGAEIRVVNGLILGLGFSALGCVFCVAIRLAFPAGSVGVHLAEGSILFATALLGLRIGASLGAPLWRSRSLGVVRSHARRRRGAVPAKILDTSVIIDGRIGDILRAGFVEGDAIVPEFVLTELQTIADSSNSLRRRKGRRGLETLRQLMEDESVNLRVSTRDFRDVQEVDRKLIRLAKEERAMLITTDYNLNRVAQVEGVRILNVNELANAVKLRFLPGEEIDLQVIDRGEEINQGVGYLDDGTMVVVENGRRHVGRTIRATVKSTLQTEAGRMLFAEPAGEAPRWEH